MSYSDIMLIDPEGDAYYECPHLYAEFTGSSGPFSGFRFRLSVMGEEIDLDDSWHRTELFPTVFSRPAPDSPIHKTEKIHLDPQRLRRFQAYEDPLDTLYAVDSRFDFLRPGDIIAVANSGRTPDESDHQIQILYVQKGTFMSKRVLSRNTSTTITAISASAKLPHAR